MATLKAHHPLRKLCQPIDQFSLALVAPLGADDNDMTSVLFTHGLCLLVYAKV
jgi:hypothetical protein